jgi:hypothetical protein
LAAGDRAAAQSLTIPQFNQCVISAGTDATPISLSRWTTTNPQITFVASSDAGLAIGRKPKFQTYLTRSGTAGTWRLWLLPTTNDSFVPFEAQLVAAPGSRQERAFAGQNRGDWLIFDLDPTLLLAAFPGQESVAVGLVDPPTKDGRSRRNHASGSIDLARLRSLLQWAPELERRAAAGSCTPSDIAPIEPLDPRAYSLCETSINPWASWNQGYVKVVWQRHLHRPGESYTYLDFRISLTAADAQPLLAAPLGPAGDPLDAKIEAHLFPDWIDLSKRAGIKVLDQQKLRVRFTGDWGSTEMMLVDANNQWRRPFYEQIVANNGDLLIEVLSPRGQPVQSFVVPAGTISQGKARMRASLQELASLLTDPLRNCAPPNAIVVT